MSDHWKGFAVTLDRDYKDEDGERILDAIRMVKGVQSVTPSVVSLDDTINRAAVRAEITKKIWAALE